MATNDERLRRGRTGTGARTMGSGTNTRGGARINLNQRGTARVQPGPTKASAQSFTQRLRSGASTVNQKAGDAVGAASDRLRARAENKAAKKAAKAAKPGILRRVATKGGGVPLMLGYTAGAGALNMESPTDLEGFSEGTEGTILGDMGRGIAARAAGYDPEYGTRDRRRQAMGQQYLRQRRSRDASLLSNELRRQQRELSQLEAGSPEAEELQANMEETRAHLRSISGRKFVDQRFEKVPKVAGAGGTETEEDTAPVSPPGGRRTGEPAAVFSAESPTILDEELPTPPTTELGGSFMVADNVAAAAVPIDYAGLRRARQAAAARGDWEAVEASYRRGNSRESRRERLRDIVSSSQGLNQSFGDMLREGLRRRAAAQQLEQMNTEDLQAQNNQAALRRTMAITPSDRISAAQLRRGLRKDEREAQQAATERGMEFLTELHTRMNADGEEVIDYQARNQDLQLLTRGGVPTTVENVQIARDMRRLRDALNTVAGEEAKVTLQDFWAGEGPDNPFDIGVPVFSALGRALGFADTEQPNPQTVQEGLAYIANVAQTREDEDLVWDDRVVNLGGTPTGEVDAQGNPQFTGGVEVELSQIPEPVRRLVELYQARQGNDQGIVRSNG